MISTIKLRGNDKLVKCYKEKGERKRNCKNLVYFG